MRGLLALALLAVAAPVSAQVTLPPGTHTVPPGIYTFSEGTYTITVIVPDYPRLPAGVYIIPPGSKVEIEAKPEGTFITIPEPVPPDPQP